MMHPTATSPTHSSHRPWILLLPVALGAALLILALTWAAPAAVQAQSDLSVDIVAGYNLVVDSNVTSPSTYAPSVATVMGRFCNTSGATLTSVYGYIGDFAANTPGLYPTRDSSTFAGIHDHLLNTGSYAFTHIGGRTGLSDARRYVGSLAPGECRVQYWHFTYPRRGNPNNTGEPVWGLTRDPNDDLWLEFDIWATGSSGGSPVSNSATWRMTMRNEISALANKIQPNPDGRWFNTDASTIQPGDIITSNGVLYTLGNINQGFDNDGDSVPDYNAWLQPVGDPAFDPSCFRLIRTTGVLTVSRSGGLPDLIVPFTNQLYFTNLPTNNNGVRGEVRYTFLALDGPCSTTLTPYQEVASGSDNEKFNGDYGAGIPPVGSSAPTVALTKTGETTITPAAVMTYTIDVANSGARAAGLPLSNVPLVVSDTVPVSTTYQVGSAAATISFAPNTGVTLQYSRDGGQTWSDTEDSSVTHIQWWFNDPLPAGGSARLSFQVQVDAAYDPPGTAQDGFAENCAEANFGAGAPFAASCVATMIDAGYSLGDLVWQDDDGDGLPDAGEAGIPGVTVWLYWDRNGDGSLDDGDVLVDTAVTGASGDYSFTNLAAADFLVVVDSDDPDLPAGYSPTTPAVHAVPGLGSTTTSPYLGADFGFGPSLAVDKTLITANPAREDQLVTYTIDVTNLRPGDGSGAAASCEYTVWATALEPAHSGTGGNDSFTNPTNAFGANELDGLFASALYATGANKLVGGTGFNQGSDGGAIQQVEALFHVYVDGLLTNDFAQVDIFVNDVSIAGTPHQFTTAQLNQFRPAAANAGSLVWDVTALRAWSWTDFNAALTNLDMNILGEKSGGPDNLTLYLDAMGFRITTDRQCGGADDTLSPVPLTDTYDADKLQFVSATPPQTSSATGGADPYANTGTLTWSNVGPIYAGGSQTLTVTFRAISDLSGTATTNVTNTAAVQDATFLSGRPANDDSDSVTHPVQATGAIGDTIWNNNGAGGGVAGNNLQDGSEQGLAGVLVWLTAATNVTINGVTYPAGSTIMTATTDADGHYLFEGLPNATYTVHVDNSSLPGMVANYDPDGTLDHQSTAVISNANEVLNRDFGYTVPNQIYGQVWRDYDGDGVEDSGDPGISGVDVTLYQWNGSSWTAVSSVTTDADGNYRFSSIGDGEYYVATDPNTLPDAGSTTWNNTADPDGDLDDASGTSPGVDTITVAGGEISGSHDFGYAQSGVFTLSGTVYGDWNENGDFDGLNPDAGFGGITVTLLSATGEVISTTTTAGDGSYSFGSLPPGTYTVAVDANTVPAQYTVAETSGPVTLSTASVTDVDFGYQPAGAGAIGDFVWFDADGDGVQDAGESGLADIDVYLYLDTDGSGSYTQVLTATTDANGAYSFGALPPGDYRVVVADDDAQLPTDANGALYVPSTAASADVTLAAGATYADADFGFATGGLIGDLIWYDNNGNGVPDIGEAGIPGVVITLTANVTVTIGGVTYTPGQVIATDTTDADGLYAFPGLPGGVYTYTVTVDAGTLPATVGATPTGDPDGTFDGTAVATLTGAGQVDRSNDFGYQPTNRIGDLVWLDLDGDGVQNGGEPGIAGVVITLTLSGGGVYTTSTDADGYYSFGNGIVTDGAHTVSVDSSTLPASIQNPTYDLDGTGTPHTTAVAVSGGDRFDVDFGYQYSGAYSVSGNIFFDQDNDGGAYVSGTDSGFAGLVVYLRDNDSGLVITTTTTITGYYQFDNLPDGGNFTVAVNTAAPQLEGMTQTAEPDDLLCTDLGSSCNNRTTFTISGGNVTDQDFGFYALMDCGDLANSYNTLLASEGACHIIGDHYLGASPPDAEADGIPDAQAGRSGGGDDGDGIDDEDGVLRTGGLWTTGSTVSLNVTVVGDNGYLVGWFDWNGDGDFADPGELVIFGAVAAGSNSLPLTLPDAYTTGDTLRARFRLYDGAPATLSPTGLVTNGEVEDYYWAFEPTHIGLSAFGAGTPLPVAAGAALFLLAAGLWLARRRRR